MNVRLLVVGAGSCALCACLAQQPAATYGQPKNVDTIAPVAGPEALAAPVRTGELLYVPAYSSIYTTAAHQTMPLTVILSVRNTDPARSILLRSAKYYDSGGELLKEVVPMARVLPPLATFDHVVDLSDDSGGTGANFLVEWVADDAGTHAPLVETVNLQAGSGRSVSFTSRAVVLRSLVP